jgi:hypothetical protein
MLLFLASSIVTFVTPFSFMNSCIIFSSADSFCASDLVFAILEKTVSILLFFFGG